MTAKSTKAPAARRVSEEGYTILPLDQLVESPENPRKTFNQVPLAELAESIKEFGVLQALLVRPLGGKKPRYEIVCGHRRFRAARLAGVAEVPCSVRLLDDREAMWAAIIENTQREDVTPLEESASFASMVAAGVEAEEIAARVKRPVRFIAERLRLQQLIPTYSRALEEQMLPVGGALLLSILPPDRQEDLSRRSLQIPSDGARPDWTVASVRAAIHASSRRMSDVHWDLDDPTYSERGACSLCPLRTGTQGDLWQTTTATERCLDAACFDLRGKAWLERQRAAGVRVVEGKYQPDHGHENVRGRAMPLSMDGDHTTAPTWGELAPGATRTIWVTPYNGTVVTVERATVAKALIGAGRTADAALIQPPTRADDAAAGAARREAERQRLEDVARKAAEHQMRVEAVLASRVLGYIDVPEPNLLAILVHFAAGCVPYGVCGRVCASNDIAVADTADATARDALKAAVGGGEKQIDTWHLLIELLIEGADVGYGGNRGGAAAWRELQILAGLQVPEPTPATDAGTDGDDELLGDDEQPEDEGDEPEDGASYDANDGSEGGP